MGLKLMFNVKSILSPPPLFNPHKPKGESFLSLVQGHGKERLYSRSETGPGTITAATQHTPTVLWLLTIASRI